MKQKFVKKNLTKFFLKILIDDFDAKYYLQMNPDVLTAGIDAEYHFFNYGVFEFRQPNENFDPIKLSITINSKSILLVYFLKKFRKFKNLQFTFDYNLNSFYRLLSTFNNVFNFHTKDKFNIDKIESKKILVIIDSLPPLEKLGQGAPRMLSILKELNKSYLIYYIYRNPYFKICFWSRLHLRLALKNVSFLGPFNDSLLLAALKSLKRSDFKIWVSRISNIREILELTNEDKLLDLDIILDLESFSQQVENSSNFENMSKYFTDSSRESTDFNLSYLPKKTKFVTVNQLDSVELISKFTSAKPVILGHHVLVKKSIKNFHTRQNLFFLGNCSNLNSSNSLSLIWFSNQIFPQVLKFIPDIDFVIVGSIHDKVKESIFNSQIKVMGEVKNPSSTLEKTRVMVAPNLVSQGIPHKVHHACSTGTPVVLLPALSRQLDWTHLKHCYVAQNSEDLVRGIVELYTNEHLWNQISKNMIDDVKERNNRKIFSESIDQIMSP